MLHKLFEKAGLHLQFYFVAHRDVIGISLANFGDICTDCVTNELVLQTVEDRNILYTIKRRMAVRIGHNLHRNCLLKYVSEGKLEGTDRRGRRRKQLLDDVKGKREYTRI